ncbi:MAG: hypothetical protein ACI94Y_004219 [Maribacter sp.]|jgi:hypothetical protein
MKQLIVPTLFVIFLVYACGPKENMAIQSLPSFIVSAAILDQDKAAAIFWKDNDLQSFYSQHEVLFSNEKTILSTAINGNQLLLQESREDIIEHILLDKNSKELEFQKWKIYQLDTTRNASWNVPLYLSFTEGHLLVSRYAYMVEETLFCIDGDGKTLVEGIPSIARMNEGEVYQNLSYFSLGMSPKFMKDLNIQQIKKGHVIGRTRADSNQIFEGELLLDVEMKALPDTAWQRSLSILPNNLSYLGLHNYQIQNNSLEKSILESMLFSKSNHLYASFLMKDYVGQDDLFFMMDVGEPAADLLADIAAKYGIISESTYPLFPIKRIVVKSLCNEINDVPFIPCINKPYVISLDNYLIFSTSENNLEKYLEQYLVNNTLSNGKEFISLLNEVDVTALNGSLHYFIYTPENNIYDKEGLLQINSLEKEKKYPIHIFQRNKSISDKKMKTAWVFHADAPIITEVEILPSKEGGKTIIFQDSLNTLFLIDKKSDLLGFQKLDEKIISKIHYFQGGLNNDDRYVFNTRNKIYLIDSKGKNLHNFPIKLSSPASNGIELINFPNTKSVYGFLSCENGNYYGYDLIQGMKPMPSWNPLIGTGSIAEDMVFLIGKDETHLTYLDKDRKFNSLDRKAQYRFSPLEIGTEFYDNYQVDANVKNKERFVFYNGKNKLKIINKNGGSFFMPLDKEIKNGQFILLDILGSKQKDYIFLTPDFLYLYAYENDEFLLKWRIENKNGLTNVFEVKIDTNQSLLGGSSKNKEKIYLFNKNGEIESGFPLAGSKSFKIITLENNKKLIITTLNNNVVSYVK